MNNVCYYRAPVGVIFKIVDDGINVKEVNFAWNACGCCMTAKASDIGAKVKKQLEEYFRGERKTFDLPLDPDGTKFQKRVWKALLDIPYGEVRSYKEIAEAAGCPRGARAVGNANNKNPVCIIIPCHRCIASDGSIGGYDGGIEIKKRLLEVEGYECRNVR